MRFKTVQEAFNFYRHFSVEDIEKRAAAIIDLKADLELFNKAIPGPFKRVKACGLY